MADAQECDIPDAKTTTPCDICGREVNKGWAFGFKKPASEGAQDGGMIIKCHICAARHTPMLRRSLIVSIVVGTVLTLLNQGDLLIAGDWTEPLYWKIPLTYCVPFMVATYGALSNGRR